MMNKKTLLKKIASYQKDAMKVIEKGLKEIKKDPVYALENNHLEIMAAARLELDYLENWNVVINERSEEIILKTMEERMSEIEGRLIGTRIESISTPPWEVKSTGIGTVRLAMISATSLRKEQALIRELNFKED